MEAVCCFDVVVVGASIAGASLAIHLGRAGLAVALIDKDRFPRRKACGEGVSEIALEALGRLGLEEDLVQLGGRPFYSYRIDLGGRSFDLAPRRRRRLKGIGMQRYKLDRLLAERAATQPLVETFFGSSVTGILPAGERHRVRLATGFEIEGRRLVLADGASSHNASRLGVPKRKTRKAPLWGISYTLEGRYEGIPEDVLVLLKDGFEVNCTPVGENRLNISFLAEKEAVPGLQDESVRGSLLAEATEKSGFRGRPEGRPLQVGPVGSTRRPYVHGSILLVGDAAESLDPIAGMGMTHGILMAEIAAASIVSHLRDGTPLERTLRDYERAAARMSRPYRGFTQLTATLLRSRARLGSSRCSRGRSCPRR